MLAERNTRFSYKIYLKLVKYQISHQQISVVITFETAPS